MFFGTRSDFSGPYFWGVGHIIFMVVGTILIGLICYFGRDIPKKKFKLLLFINGLSMLVVDVGIIIWQVVANGYFDLYEDLPIHLCAVMKFLYIAVFFVRNEKVERMLYTFMFTLGIVGGLANFFLPGVLEYYPVWAFRTMASLYTHWTMVLYGVWAYVCKYYVPKYSDILYGMVPLTILTAICLPLNHFYDWDYMFYEGKYQVFNIVASSMPHALYIIVLYTVYVAAIAAFVVPYRLIADHKRKKANQ